MNLSYQGGRKVVMEFIRTIREKHLTAKENEIKRQAEELIYVADFIDSLYIAYNGVPLVPIEKDWTTKEILEKLHSTRTNYITAKCKEESVGAFA